MFIGYDIETEGDEEFYALQSVTHILRKQLNS